MYMFSFCLLACSSSLIETCNDWDRRGSCLRQCASVFLPLASGLWGGGFRLSAAGAKRPVLAVLDLFGGPAAHDECVFGLRKCDGRHPCALHGRWNRVRSEFRGGLSRVQVSEIAAGNGSCTS